MQLIIALAILISTAGYLGLVPEAAAIAELPLALVGGSVIMLGVLYVFARS